MHDFIDMTMVYVLSMVASPLLSSLLSSNYLSIDHLTKWPVRISPISKDTRIPRAIDMPADVAVHSDSPFGHIVTRGERTISQSCGPSPMHDKKGELGE